MTFALPDARWQDPALLIPRKTPVGPVAINWANPITRGLRTALPMRREYGLKSLIDDPIFPNGWVFNETNTFYKLDGVEFNGGNECVRSVDAVDIDAVRPQGTSLGIFTPTRSSVDPSYYYFFYSNNFQNHAFYSGGTTSPLSWFVHGNQITTIPSYHQHPTGVPAVVAGNWDYTNDVHKLFYNEYSVTSAQVESTSADFYCIGGRDDATARYSNSICQFFFQWDRVLTDAEHIALARDPYQLVMPV